MAQAIAPGIDFANRFHIWMGVMANLGSPIWLLFLMAGAVDLAFKYRFSLLSALPGSDISHSGGAVQVLLLATLALLFLPKILAMFLAIPKAGQFGGALRLVASTLIETAIWTLLAPAIALLHAVCRYEPRGRHVRWTAQNRSDTGLGFLERFHIFWMPPVIGVIATTVLAIWAREELWLLSPILVGWLIAPVLAWMTSQPKLGEWARRHRLFLTPEENPELCPAELRFVDQAAAVSTNSLSLPFGGIARAVIGSPYAFRARCSPSPAEGWRLANRGLSRRSSREADRRRAGGFGPFSALCLALGCRVSALAASRILEPSRGGGCTHGGESVWTTNRKDWSR